jgi:hypothetical protein
MGFAAATPKIAQGREDEASMAPALHVIAGPGPGQLATMAHPRDEPWSPQELGALARAGVQVLVSSAEPGPDTAGIEVVPFPTATRPTAAPNSTAAADAPATAAPVAAASALPAADQIPPPAGQTPPTGQMPPSADQMRQEAAEVVALAVRLAREVRAGRFVVTQSAADNGRSTILATMTLALLGIRPGEALRRTSSGTPTVTPDWLHDFVATHS